jgi:hypothetical protein
VPLRRQQAGRKLSLSEYKSVSNGAVKVAISAMAKTRRIGIKGGKQCFLNDSVSFKT